MDKKFKCVIILLLAFCGIGNASSQRERRSAVSSSAIKAPEMVSVLRSAIPTGDRSVFAGWNPLDRVHSYSFRLYTAKDHVLQREITNLQYPAFLVSNLAAGTEYYVTVSAVYKNSRNTSVESRESEAAYFTTREECTGGQILTACNGHCTALCEVPDPTCDRSCRRGCACPLSASVWHEGSCIPSELCPTQRGIPEQVTGLSAIESRVPGSDVRLSWDFNEDASVYEVRVRLARNMSIVVQLFEVHLPVAIVSDLIPYELYTFSVRAYIRRPTVSARSALLPPPGIIVTDVGETTFTVLWLSNANAVRYSFVLFDETRRNILYENGQIGGNSITIAELTPGSDYYFALATAGRGEKIGRYGGLTKATTLGENNGIDVSYEATVELVVVKATTVRPSAVSGDTACLQEYQRIERFYEQFPNAVGGPRYPSCNEDGLYVTTLCQQRDPSACWCIEAEDGEKRRGSDFGGRNSKFPLNCDRYEDLDVGDINLRVSKIQSSSVEFEWDAIPDAQAFVVYQQGHRGERTTSLNENVRRHTFSRLQAGNNYKIGIYAVDVEGGSSPMTVIDVTTSLVDPPDRIKVLSKTSDRLTVSWRVAPTASGFNVRLLNAKTMKVLQTHDNLIANEITFSGLKVLVRYVVEIRAVARLTFDYLDGEELVFTSDPASIEVLVQCELPPVDVIFAFDISLHVTWEGLQATKNLAANLVEALPGIEEANGTRVAAVRYQNSANTIFDYKRFEQTGNAVGALQYIRFGGSQQLHKGVMLDRIYRDFFAFPPNKNYVQRKNALSVVVIFSTDSSGDSYRSEATRLKRRTKVITVGVRGISSTVDMEEIASNPNLNILASSFDELEEATDILLRRMCTLI